MVSFSQSSNPRSIPSYIRGKVSPRNIVGLVTSGPIDSELWIMLDYYAEVASVGSQFLFNLGIKDKRKSAKVLKNFQAYIRQARTYYDAAKSLPVRSSGLLYYYCFLNLAKAAIVTRNPNLAGKKILHGLKVDAEDNSKFLSQRVITNRGVFPLLYEWYFGKSLNVKSFKISQLIGYCTDIAFQSDQAKISERMVQSGFYSFCSDSSNKTCWNVFAIPEANKLLNYPTASKSLVSSYEQAALPTDIVRELFELTALNHQRFKYFQSKNTRPWNSNNTLPVVELRNEFISNCGIFFKVNYFPDEYDFQLSLPYKGAQPMDETIAIYIIMYYISCLIRYNPAYLEKLLGTEPAWILDSFVRSCTLTFLRAMTSRIIGDDYQIRNR